MRRFTTRINAGTPPVRNMDDLRMTAYKLDISPDAAEDLAKEVGEELAVAALEKVIERSEYQATLPFHVKKKSNATLFTQEALECRKKFHASRKFQETVDNIDKNQQETKAAQDKGFNPDAPTLLKQIKLEFESGRATHEEYLKARRLLEDMDESIKDTTEH